MDDVLSRIIRLKEQSRITDAQFLADLGLSKTTLSDWKTGRNSSYRKHIANIADYLKVSADALLGRTDDETVELIEAFRQRPEMKLLFSATKNATKDQIVQLAKMIDSFSQ